MTDLLLGLEVLALLILAPLTVGSAIYLNGIYRRTPRPRLPLLRALVTNVRLAATVGSYFAYTITARILDLSHLAALPVFPPPWSTLVAGLAIICLMVPTITYALAVRRMRQP